MGYTDLESIDRSVSVSFSQAHNLKVVGSNPTPATNKINDLAVLRGGFFAFVRTFVRTSGFDFIPDLQGRRLTVGVDKVTLSYYYITHSYISDRRKTWK